MFGDALHQYGVPDIDDEVPNEEWAEIMHAHMDVIFDEAMKKLRELP